MLSTSGSYRKKCGVNIGRWICCHVLSLIATSNFPSYKRERENTRFKIIFKNFHDIDFYLISFIHSLSRISNRRLLENATKSFFNIDWTIYICSFCIYIIIFRQLARFTVCEATFSKARQGTRILWSINNRDAIFDKRSREFKRVEYPLLVVSRSVSRRVNMLPVRGLTNAISRRFYERTRDTTVDSLCMDRVGENESDRTRTGKRRDRTLCAFICSPLAKANLTRIRELLRAWRIKSRHRDKETSIK